MANGTRLGRGRVRTVDTGVNRDNEAQSNDPLNDGEPFIGSRNRPIENDPQTQSGEAELRN